MSIQGTCFLVLPLKYKHNAPVWMCGMLKKLAQATAVLGIPCPSCAPPCHILPNFHPLPLNVYRDMAKVKDLLLPTLSITGDMYPETLAHLVVTRAPGFFDAAFSAIRRMLPPDTQAKIQASACSLLTSWAGCANG